MRARFGFAIRAAFPRARSEDRVAIMECDEALVVAIDDGAGGTRGGRTAADRVIEAVRGRTEQRPLDPYDVRAWSEILIQVDAELARSPGGGETTAIVVVVAAHGIVGVSVGDSEVWIVNDGCVDRLTEKQDRTRLGTGRADPKAFHRRSLDGVLVAGTDGLFRHAPAEAIALTCSSGDDAAAIADQLVRLPRLRSGAYPDDVAIAVVTAAPKQIAS
jgi:serine/threonine protein phosphatase PrpC